MNPIQKLKEKLVKLKLNDKISLTDNLDITINKEQIIKDGKAVRKTFTNEDLQPRLSTS